MSPAEAITEPPPRDRPRFRLISYLREKQEAFELEPGGIVGIGRGPENLLRLDDPRVSRVHARLHIGIDGLEVEDLGSANGATLERGRPASECDQRSLSRTELEPHRRFRVEPGDVLRIGGAVVTFEAIGDAPNRKPVGRSSDWQPPVLVDEGMRRLYALARKAARSDMSVLLLGETGAGKEVLAETIHKNSRRASGPFLRLNCATLSESLLESELFGHERGAFTGAHTPKPGLLEAASGGSVFLDEVAELSPRVQAKLLRVVEDRTVLRVGATKPRPVDTRFVTATNRDLAKAVREDRFRGDLFYRIGGVVLTIPPLRHRVTEIEPLARHFLREFCRKSGTSEPTFTPEAVDRMRSHDWPGNVRELRNVTERAALLANGEIISAEHVDLGAASELGGDTTVVRVSPELVRSLRANAASSGDNDDGKLERLRVMAVLEACGGNQTRAAKLIGVSRRALVKRIDELKLPRPIKGAAMRR